MPPALCRFSRRTRALVRCRSRCERASRALSARDGNHVRASACGSLTSVLSGCRDVVCRSGPEQLRDVDRVELLPRVAKVASHLDPTEFGDDRIDLLAPQGKKHAADTPARATALEARTQGPIVI